MAYVSLLHRPLAALLLSIPLVACTTDVLAPPARIDGGARVGAISPAPVAMPEQKVAAYPAEGPVAIASQTSVTPAASSAVPPEGVNMDAMLGVEPVVGLAQEQSREIAEGNTTQPVVAGIGEGDVRQLAGTPEPAAPAVETNPGFDPDLPPLTPAKNSAVEAKVGALSRRNGRRLPRNHSRSLSYPAPAARFPRRHMPAQCRVRRSPAGNG